MQETKGGQRWGEGIRGNLQVHQGGKGWCKGKGINPEGDGDRIRRGDEGEGETRYGGLADGDERRGEKGGVTHD